MWKDTKGTYNMTLQTHILQSFFFPAIQKHQVRKKGSHQSIGEKMASPLRTLISHLLLKINVQYRGLPNCETNMERRLAEMPLCREKKATSF